MTRAAAKVATGFYGGRMRWLVVPLCLVPAVAWGEPRQPGSVTLEAGLGVGLTDFRHIQYGSDAGELDAISGPSLAGAVGIGLWKTPQLALLIRVSATNVRFERNGFTFPPAGHLYEAIFGPGFQYWMNDGIWLEGGVNVMMLYGTANRSCGDLLACGKARLGPDLRFGFAWGQGAHSWNLALEVAGDVPSTTGDVFAVAVLAGYQLL